MELNIFFDLIGYLSIFFAITSFLATNTNKMRINGMISTILFAISIYHYSGMNGVFVSCVSFLTKLLSLKFKEEQLYLLKFFSPILALIFYFFFNSEGLYGLLPALSLIFIIFADLQKDILKMKYIYYGSTICWLIYAIHLNSIPAIIYDIIGFIVLTYSIYKIKSKIKNKII